MDLDTPELTLKAVTSGADADTLMRRFRRLCRHAQTITRIERDTAGGLERSGDSGDWRGQS